MKRRVGAIFAACLAFLFLAAPALADTWTVTGTGDQTSGCVTSTHLCPSLRAAIAASEATKNLKDVINVPPGVVSLNNDLVIQSDMEILGDSARTTILDGNLKYRAFRITTAGTDVDIRHLTIRNAQAGQAAVTDGGGIYNQGVLELSYVRITTSRAPEGGGGAIANNRGVIVMDHSLIDGNTAQSVGGIWNVGGPETANRGWLRIDDSTVFNNSAALAGVGGIASTGGLSSILLLFRATVANNNGAATRGLGGGVYVTTGQAQSTGSLLARNMAAGVVSNCDGSVAVVNNGGNVEDEKTCGFSIQSVNPQLATSLKNEGGEVDVLPIANGPAVDVVPVGTNTCASGTRDARGMYRPQGTACDAGAYELDQPATVTITDGPSGTVTTGDVLFNFQASELDVTVQCQLTGPGQGGGFVGCYKSNAQPYDKLADGTYTFSVRAVSSSFPNPPTTTRTFTVDTTPPETTITGGPSGPTNVSNPQFTFTSSETPSTFECAMDSGQFAACTSPYTAPTLTPGQHTFRVRATDATQHTDQSPATRTFTFDNVAPNTTIDTGPSNTVASTSAAFTYSSSEPNSTFECKLDSGNFGACPSGYTGLAQGVHTFQVRAIDAATNVDATPASRTWTVDTVGPETTITNGPPTVAASTSATFTYTSSEGNSTFECALDGAAFGTCPAGYTGLSQGAHTFQVRARDALGNPDPTPASRTWTVDTVAPDTTITSGPPTATASTTAAFTFISNEGGVLFECSLDSAAFGSCPVNYAGLAQGSHTFQVRAKDAAGNLDPTPAGQTWTVDTTNPDTTITGGPATVAASTSATFTYTSSEGNSTFECALDAAAFGTCPAGYTGLAQGSHTFQVRAKDAAGNLDPTPAGQTWTVDTVNPDTTISAPAPSPSNDTTPTFGFTSNEAGATFQCRIDGTAFATCPTPFTSTALAAGTHTLDVRARDAAGNLDGTPASQTFEIDLTAPTAGIDSAPTSPTNDNTPTFGFSSEAGATFECRVDAAAFAQCTSPHTTAQLADGTHTFEVRAKDVAGNTGAAASRTIVVDTVAPDTTLTNGPASPSNDPTPTFTFTGTGTAFECRVDSAVFTTCSSPHTTVALNDGSHTFQVRARDAAGNVDTTPAAQTFVIDTGAPETTLTVPAPSPSNDTTPTFAFTGTGAAFECRIDTAAFAACTSPFTSTPLSAGTHTFEVRALDAAGNADLSPASQTFVIDTTAPQTSILAGPNDPTNVRRPPIAFSSSESGSTFECALDSTTFAACTSPFTPASDLAAGSHTFQVRATDPAGNLDASPASVTFAVDLTAPDTTLLTTPPAQTNDNTPTFTFSSEAGARFECRVDSAAFASCTTPFTAAALGDGAHAFDVRAIDSAGNVDGSPAHSAFTVDTVLPQTTIDSGPPNPGNSSRPQFTFSSSEANSTFRCTIDGGTEAACSSPFTTATLPDGTHTLAVVAVDQATNRDDSPATRTFVIDTQAPTTTITAAPTSPSRDTTPTFEFSANEANSTFECRVGTGQFALCTSPHTTAALLDGSRTFEVRAKDAAGNVGAAASRTLVIDTTAPETTILTGPSGPTNDPTPTFTFGSSESGSAFECRVDTEAFAVCTSPATTLDLDDGTHTFAVRATDAAGNQDASAATQTFVVDTDPPDTTLLTGAKALSNNRTPSFTFSGTGSGFQCRVDGGAYGACASGYTAPQLDAGSHTFDVRAVDAADNVDGSPASQTFVIDLTAPQTTIDTGPPAATNDPTADFTFSASESGSTFKCRVDNVAFATCTSPHATVPLSQGTHTFEVLATDPAGNDDPSAASRTFTVDTTAPAAPAITSGPKNPGNDTTPTFEFTGEAGASFQCRVDGGSYAGCTSPRTTAALGEGGHTFEVRAVDAATNAGPAASRDFVIDVTPPVASFTVGPSGPTNDATPEFEFTAADSTFECRLDGGTFAACTSPRTTATLPEGTHTFEIRATDSAGNTDTESRTFVVDVTKPPAPVITEPTPGQRLTSSTVGVRGTAEAETVVTVYEGTVSQGSGRAGTAPWLVVAVASDGTHTFTARAKDDAGNESDPSVAVTFSVDSDLPDTTISGTDGAINTATPTFTLGADEDTSKFECRVVPADFSTCTSPYTPPALGEGPHTIEVRAFDLAGNPDNTPATRNVVVDLTAPAAPAITGGPTGASNISAAEFTFTTTEPDATLECALDDGAFAECVSPARFEGIGEGAHTFRVRTRDDAGNTGDATRAFAVDRTPPAAPAVESGPAGATTDASPAFAFTATDTVDCKLDGPNGAEGSFGPCASPKSFDALAPGEYLFTVRSTDAAGNRTASTRAFTVTVPQQQTPTPTPTPTPTATATPSPTPQPTPSQTVVVAPKAGTILVKVPGGKTFEPLDVTKGIPNGSEVDARKGHVTLTSIPKAGAPPETAEFWDGLFIVTQKRGVTTVKLSEKLTGCPKGLRSSAKAAAKKTKVRRLWGSGKGSFRTEGRYSAATVRGTVWLVQDTCTTTLTRVTQGVVAVNDFAKKKTIVLKKGKRYTAKRR